MISLFNLGLGIENIFTKQSVIMFCRMVFNFGVMFNSKFSSVIRLSQISEEDGYINNRIKTQKLHQQMIGEKNLEFLLRVTEEKVMKFKTQYQKKKILLKIK